MTRAILSGATKASKHDLVARGWRWDGAVWAKTITDAQAQALRAAVGHDAQKEAARAIRGNIKGCVLTVDGIARWTSATYIMPAARGSGSHTRADADADGYGWNTDGNGNPVAARRIPGSAPDDRV